MELRPPIFPAEWLETQVQGKSGMTHTEFMRSWTKCWRTKYVGVTMAQFVEHFGAYRKWFEFESLIMPGRRIGWEDLE